jgi:signal transduction histidine kinase
VKNIESNSNPSIASSRRAAPNLRKQLLWSLPIIVLVSAFTTFLYKFGWFQWIENATLDLIVHSVDLETGSVFLVEITDDDYKTVFAGQSPLNKNKLSEIIGAIADSDPSVIVLDVDTGAGQLKRPDTGNWKGPLIIANSYDLLDETKTAELLHVPAEAVPLLPICERTILKSQQTVPDETSGFGPSKNTQSDYAGVLDGIAFMPRDLDGFVRRYCRRIKVMEPGSESKTRLADSLPWSIAKAKNPELINKVETEANDVVLLFAKDQDRIPRTSVSNLLANKKLSGWKDIMKGKIAIIGGTYRESRDMYKTPAGVLPGMNIVAQAVETELQFGGVKAVNEMWILFAQVIASFVFVAINFRFRNTMIPLVGLIAIPFAALMFSFLAFRTLALWSSFVPVLFAVQFHALFNHIQEVRRRNVELKTANAELIRTRTELAKAVDTGEQQERKRIAAGLHDETLMNLFEVETIIDALRDKEETAELYEKCHSSIQKTRKNVREVMNNLYPSVLRDHSLAKAIESLIVSTVGSQLQFQFTNNTEDVWLDKLDSPSRMRVYRIVQNALRNIIEHSEADACKIELAKNEQKLVLTISDNGKGFDKLVGREDSRGVRNMREYAELLDGEISWSTPATEFGKGTQITLTIPVGN